MRDRCTSPPILPFTEHGAHTCILIGTSTDGLSVPTMEVPLPNVLFHQVHPLFLLDAILTLYPFQNQHRLQSLPGLLALYWILQTFVPIVITLAIPYGAVMLFHLDPQLFIAHQEQLLAPPIPLPVPVSWQPLSYYHMPLPRCYLVWQVLLLMSIRLMISQNPSQTLGMRVMMMKTVSSQITAH